MTTGVNCSDVATSTCLKPTYARNIISPRFSATIFCKTRTSLFCKTKKEEEKTRSFCGGRARSCGCKSAERDPLLPSRRRLWQAENMTHSFLQMGWGLIYRRGSGQGSGIGPEPGVRTGTRSDISRMSEQGTGSGSGGSAGAA